MQVKIFVRIDREITLKSKMHCFVLSDISGRFYENKKNNDYYDGDGVLGVQCVCFS